MKITGHINKGDLAFIKSLFTYSLNGTLDLGDAEIEENTWNGLFGWDSYGENKMHIRKLIIPKSLPSYRETKVDNHSSSGFSSVSTLSVDSLIFNTKVDVIDKWTFNKKMSHITIGESVETIEEYAFSYQMAYVNIKSVLLPRTLKYIGNNAFEGVLEDLSCSNISEFPQLEYLGHLAFVNIFKNERRSNMETLPDTIKLPKIKEFYLSAFEYKAGMHIFLGENLNTINLSAGSLNSSPWTSRSIGSVTFHIASKTPPSSQFSLGGRGLTVYVPKDAVEVYKQTNNWKNVTILPEPQLLNRIEIDKHEVFMEVNDQIQLTATPIPDNADDVTILWESDNKASATVNNSGLVTAVAPGRANIIAKSSNGTIRDTCQVIVKAHAERIELSETSISLKNVGDTLQLKATIFPNNAYDKSVTWKSANEQVCRVSTSGLVTATGSGTTIVTVTTVDGGHSATCVVKVLQHVTGLAITKHSTSLKVGEKEQLIVVVNPDNADNKTVKWSSVDDKIASVDTNGNVQALKAGRTWIKVASVDNVNAEDSCMVTVTQPVTGIILSKDNYTLNQTGDSVRLVAMVFPEDASNNKVRWSSSNENVCIVREGLVLAVAAGTTTITATTVDGDYSANCLIKVVQHVSSVRLNKTTLNLKVGEEERLTATVFPDNAENKALTWSSSNKKIAIVDTNGIVLALKAGEAWIKIVSLDNVGAEDSCKVAVTQPVTGITLSKENYTLNQVGDSVRLVATIWPSDASNKEIRWSSSNENVCIVREGLVLAVAAGTATITATTIDGEYFANCLIKVVQHVSSIGLNKTTMSLEVGEEERLTATVFPDNAENKTLTWSSSNKKIAIVDANGNVLALKAGEAWIKIVSSDNAKANDSCKVIVTQPVTGVVLSHENITLKKIGENKQLEVTVLPKDASNKNVSWSSSNEDVCVVINGKVVATGFGLAVVIVTTVDGGFMASCTVTVENENTAIESLNVSTTDQPIYNIMGRRVKALKKGHLYIRNGKKFKAK